MKVKTVVAAHIATGLSVGIFHPVIYAAEKESIGTIIVTDQTETIKQRDQKGADDQYDKDESTVYISKKLVERYKGANPADVLNQASGVYSGDARNSGALDPNVRGIQGQGRVPVTVDGTEQAITVWRGYNGANNRNYIDPNMISSITVHKSAILDRDVRTSVGGGVAVKTISIDDVVEPDNTFGFDLKLETSSNSTKPKINHLNLGMDYRDLPEYYESFYKVTKSKVYFKDPEIMVSPDKRNNARPFNLQDNAARLAFGIRQNKFDFMLAYSKRDQGNFFAGERGANQYREEMYPDDSKLLEGHIDPNMTFAANVYHPNKEVGNTSNQLETLLMKINVYFTNALKMEWGYSRTMSHYGEILPSRIRYDDLNGEIAQWPLAKIKLDTTYLNYKYKPESSSLIDLHVGFWSTKTDLDSNTLGGSPREPLQVDWKARGPSKNDSIDGTLVDGITLSQINNRRGVSLSNKTKVSSKIDITLMGNFITEDIDSRDDVFAYTKKKAQFSFFRAIPREGKRQEYNGAIKINWYPTDWLKFDASANYIGYWSKDNLHKRRLEAKDLNFALLERTRNKKIWLGKLLTDEQYKKINDYYINKYENWDGKSSVPTENLREIEQVLGMEEKSIASLDRKLEKTTYVMRMTLKEPVIIKTNNNHEFRSENNQFYNGTIDRNKKAVDPSSGNLANEVVIKDKPLSYRQDTQTMSDDEKFKQPGRTQNSAWAPSIGATLYLTDHDRVFSRYIETVRMPSIFESTIGFSGSGKANYPTTKMVPERSHTIEFGYIKNLQPILQAENAADIRINYYNTVTKKAFDRTMDFRFSQVDSHQTAGLELLARYDNGNIFTDIGVDYRLRNEVCDDVARVKLDFQNELDLPRCTEAGFPGGFLRTQLQPKYSIVANMGMRFWDESLEVGSRMRYHSQAKNKDEEELIKKAPNLLAPLNNNPMGWNATFIADAYINYQYNKHLDIEFLATNLLNEYYVDPLTRSLMPAPGRAVRLSVTSRF